MDVEGHPFAPYSTKGPYYYNPHAGRANTSAEQRRGAAKRLRKTLGEGGVTRSGYLRFDSYAAFKRSLGRTNVDLTGPRAPHMLQALTVQATGNTELRLGVYGAKAVLANAHNEGGRHLPQRKFFGASGADVREMAREIGERIAARLRA